MVGCFLDLCGRGLSLVLRFLWLFVTAVIFCGYGWLGGGLWWFSGGLICGRASGVVVWGFGL